MILLVLVLLCAILALGIRALEWLQKIAMMLETSKEEDECIDQ